jgi:TPR repeat protein
LGWLLKAAAQGNLDSYQELANLARNNPAGLSTSFAKLAGLESEAGTTSLPPVRDAGQEFSSLMKTAQAGDPLAQWSLGKIYATGQGAIEKNKSEAIAWYRKSAQAGFAAAQAALAMLLSTGQNGLSDSKEAIFWWSKSAAQGDLESQYNLALMYEKGELVACDYALSAYWLEKAARQGLATAQIRLGLAHATGRLGTPDYVEAFAWFSLAVGGGSEIAHANLEYAKSLMTPSQMSQAKLRVEALAKEIR